MPTKTPKVLHIIARFNIGGTARYLSHLIPELETKKIRACLAVGRVQLGEVEDSNLAELNFIRIENLGRRINVVADFKSYFELRKIVREFQPDLIHTHTFKAGLIGRLMYFGIPKVHTFHGHLLTDPEFSNYELKVIVTIERFLANLSRKLIVTGSNVAIDLLRMGVGKHNQYVSIPGQSSLGKCLPRELARENLGLSDEFTVLWSARVAPVKNPDLLVQVARMMPDCKFLMAGDGVMLSEIIAKAPSNMMILGFVDVKKILMAGDIFLSTSLNEGIPYSILEAKSALLPVVAVNVGALSEIIEDGANGFLVEPVAEEIVSRLQKLRTSPELVESFKSRSFSDSVNNHSNMNFADRHAELYKEILNKN